MLNPIHYSRLLLAILIATLMWIGLAGVWPGSEWDAESVPLASRPAGVSSRGGPRPGSGALPGHDILAARPLMIPTPTPVPTLSPPATPEPTATVERRLESLGHFRVTAYSDSVRNGTDGHGITKSGERTRWGVVAVDPGVIPLGSRLLIEGMGETEFTALDTGGGVRGRWVDVWFETDSEAIQHGVRESEVYLVP